MSFSPYSAYNKSLKTNNKSLDLTNESIPYNCANPGNRGFQSSNCPASNNSAQGPQGPQGFTGPTGSGTINGIITTSLIPDQDNTYDLGAT